LLNIFPKNILNSPEKRFFAHLITLLVLIIVFLSLSCSRKPDQQELNRLEDARKAAESAEAQLEQLRNERLKLEEKLAEQKKLLEQKQKEVDEAKSNLPEK
jgi:peptidoglycan hydrolase CwlO-like protein